MIIFKRKMNNFLDQAINLPEFSVDWARGRPCKEQDTSANSNRCRWGGCNKVFIDDKRARFHEQLHVPASKTTKEGSCSCLIDNCNKEFAEPRALKRHLKIHGTKQFICNVCGKKFHQKAKLVRHAVIHSRSFGSISASSSTDLDGGCSNNNQTLSTSSDQVSQDLDRLFIQIVNDNFNVVHFNIGDE
jgi:hypothetical protein